MNSIEHFDPFNDRLCRNVRNLLSEAFKSAIKESDLDPVERVAQSFVNQPLPVFVADYIDQRLIAYAAVLALLEKKNITDPFDIAMVIWDRRLFFETHEYLETHWLAASGDEKRLFQALIRAAGTYVHLEQGHIAAAKRIADKAIQGLLHHTARLARHIDSQLLIDKLTSLDPVPPMLSGTADSGNGSLFR